MGDAVTHVFADGGCIEANPSAKGGTWAWVHVAEGRAVRTDSGVLLPEQVGRHVTNNQTEFLAVLLALEALPDGWSGEVGTDSQCTIWRWTKPVKKSALVTLPYAWLERMWAVKRRLGELTWVRLDGHPTEDDFLKDPPTGKRGGPISRFQDWCDKECQRLAAAFVAPAERPPVYRYSYSVGPAEADPLPFQRALEAFR